MADVDLDMDAKEGLKGVVKGVEFEILLGKLKVDIPSFCGCCC